VTLSEYTAAARQRLRGAGIDPDEAALDARLLAQAVLGWSATRFITDSHTIPPPWFADRFEALLARRIAREPLSFIVGSREFWGLTFDVTPAVLIPRPETELVIEAALEVVPDRDASPRVVDLGTGSGCLAVAFATERPHARIVAVDTSAAALAVARRNVTRHGVDRQVMMVRCDLFAGLRGQFDLVISNPPYVADVDRAGLQPEVRDYEPAAALFAGADGLSIIRQLLAAAPGALSAGGHLVIEFGYGQAERVTGLISDTAGLTMTGIRRDLQGTPRVAIARRS
jgi:release factor glutamine methyltransferase